MENTIYIVTGGSYSDYSIYAVFDSKEKADAYEQYHNKLYGHDWYRVEEYPLNDPVLDINNLKPFWTAEIQMKGKGEYEEYITEGFYNVNEKNTDHRLKSYPLMEQMLDPDVPKEYKENQMKRIRVISTKSAAHAKEKLYEYKRELLALKW